jgi:hypothetical protein
MKEQTEPETRAALRERWRAVIAEGEVSGESIRTFCLKRAIRQSQFYYWKNRFQGEQDSSALLASRGFVFVGTTGAAMEKAVALELVVGRGWRLRIGAGVEERALRTVLSALAAQS